MAKKAMMIKEQKRESLAAQGKYPRVRLHNRCSICGRPHGFHRDFGLCRICLRKMAHQGLLTEPNFGGRKHGKIKCKFRRLFRSYL